MIQQITVDNEKCTGCNLCSKVCKIVFKHTKGIPPVVEHPEICNRCGHCVAICPEGAIKTSWGEAGPFPPEPEDPAGALDFLIRTRRSVRQYKDEPVPREILKDLVETASLAPTGCNNRDVKFTVITDRQRLKEISALTRKTMHGLLEKLKSPLGRFFVGMAIGKERLESMREAAPFFTELIDNAPEEADPILYKAPAAVIIHHPSADFSAEANCWLAVTYLMLAAQARGLGTCLIGFVTGSARNPELKSKLGVPEGNGVYACVILGYPNIRYSRQVPYGKPDITWI
ncbi:MAG: nitroreductase family protein [Chloroflexi bacterium]|nr:nitroreductase family protein [Chloroflexota bacterium]